MAKTNVSAVIVALSLAVVMSLSQILWKLGSVSVGFDIIAMITNFPLMAGFVLYGIGAVMLVFALGGGEMSTIVPIISLSIILVNILAWLLLGEAMTIMQWAGIAAVILGLGSIGYGSRGAAR